MFYCEIINFRLYKITRVGYALSYSAITRATNYLIAVVLLNSHKTMRSLSSTFSTHVFMTRAGKT